MLTLLRVTKGVGLDFRQQWKSRKPFMVLGIWPVTNNELTRLLGCIGLNGPFRQYFSLYRAVSQREGERKEK